ncbi:hypothetical protein [Dehalobacterium formicoaceticum]|uniref:hypothetical protein n=1 Tax=Dehalobacterium formicoaceticum TaxID=51515 RepID=UPI001FA8A1D5|nr:hypothetical protein [Dehalobacterium formicoaceticum]
MTITQVEVLQDASGAFFGAMKGNIVVIVDVINMSTTLEASLDAGALGVFGASPDTTRAPVSVNPEAVGFHAGRFARQYHSDLILVTEPRVGTERERREHASRAIAGIRRAGINHITVLPNLGAETVKLADFKNKVVLAVTDSGGVAYDAAFNVGATVTTATVARSLRKKGLASVHDGVIRALSQAGGNHQGISVVAASSNSLEDILAANFIAQYFESYIEHGHDILQGNFYS